jgi:hypothetical protein
VILANLNRSIPKEIYPALQKYMEKADSWLASHRNEIIVAAAGIISIVISIASGSPLSAPELATRAGSILPPIIDMTKRGENTHVMHFTISLKSRKCKPKSCCLLLMTNNDISNPVTSCDSVQNRATG